MKEAKCPICAAEVSTGPRARLGDLILCPKCERVLCVVQIRPIALDLAEGLDRHSAYYTPGDYEVQKRSVRDHRLDESNPLNC